MNPVVLGISRQLHLMHTSSLCSLLYLGFYAILYSEALIIQEE